MAALEAWRGEKASGSHAGHRKRRREQFLKTGLSEFAPDEVLEMLLFYAIPRRDTHDLARALIEQFGSLDGVLQAGPEELMRVPGMGESAAVLLPLASRAVWSSRFERIRRGTPVDTSARAAELFMRFLWGERNEMAIVMTLDRERKFLACHALGTGGSNVNFSFQGLIEMVARDGAAAVYLAHNHPSGMAVPSQQDVNTTQRIYVALRTVNVVLLDHLIIGGEDYTSIDVGELIRR